MQVMMWYIGVVSAGAYLVGGALGANAPPKI